MVPVVVETALYWDDSIRLENFALLHLPNITSAWSRWAHMKDLQIVTRESHDIYSKSFRKVFANIFTVEVLDVIQSLNII